MNQESKNRIIAEAPRDDEGNIIWDEVPVTRRVMAGALYCRVIKDDNGDVIGIML